MKDFVNKYIKYLNICYLYLSIMRLKNELYKNEQENILQQLITILNLDNDNSITLYDLDNNEIKQQDILNLLPNIRKYFSLSFVKGVKNPELLKRPWLSIIKQLLKKKYDIISHDYRMNINNEKIRTKRYIFIKKTT